ncbi:molybdate ABC transporter substrate-binding protein [Fournierella sp.]|uniref:molybdate ABC transporter substrate-binding protein n=1 Tax=Allofournierella sp. TaxID=1940256 RepID=UPI0025BBD892|nr:molybdate ABC transporter substrate-binding protein [Fournierella sp.]
MKAKNMFRMTALCMGLVLALTGCGSAAPSSVSASTAESTATSAAASQAVSSQAASAEAAQDLTGQNLMIYCGAGMQQPFEEIAAAFSEETGCEMNVTYANAAQLQTQITQSQEGAFFIAGSADEVKPVEEYVVSSTDLVKHIPVLAVAEGNPKGITGIADLAREDVTTVTGDAEATPIGKIAKKAFQDFGVTDQVTLAATTTTAPQLATVIALGEADAAIIWKENCNTEGVEICQTTDLDKYVKTVPAARLSFAADDPAADAFAEYLAGQEAAGIWAEYGYEQVQ